MSTLTGRISLTGAHGFLGTHTRILLRSLNVPVHIVGMGASFDPREARRSVDGSDRLIHIAGVNRGADEEVDEGNRLFAHQLATTLGDCDRPPATVVFANSIQSGNGTVYGQSKEEAAGILRSAAEACGATFVDVRLPNLFGEHGQPFYNSVTATFCHLLARGERPEVHEDKVLTLLHAQNAAEILVGSGDSDELVGLAVERSVSQILSQLREMAGVYGSGDMPRFSSDFDRDLFNTYRSYLPADERVLRLNRNADSRGAFFEVIRAHGSESQTSFSTTAPGITRGQHYHRRKIERFTVLAGTGRISMRSLFTGETLNFDVDGEVPVAIDMPTMWAHNISNLGSALLYTLFWANEMFDPEAPDTFPEEV